MVLHAELRRPRLAAGLLRYAIDSSGRKAAMLIPPGLDAKGEAGQFLFGVHVFHLR